MADAGSSSGSKTHHGTYVLMERVPIKYQRLLILVLVFVHVMSWVFLIHPALDQWTTLDTANIPILYFQRHKYRLQKVRRTRIPRDNDFDLQMFLYTAKCIGLDPQTNTEIIQVTSSAVARPNIYDLPDNFIPTCNILCKHQGNTVFSETTARNCSHIFYQRQDHTSISLLQMDCYMRECREEDTDLEVTLSFKDSETRLPLFTANNTIQVHCVTHMNYNPAWNLVGNFT